MRADDLSIAKSIFERKAIVRKIAAYPALLLLLCMSLACFLACFTPGQAHAQVHRATANPTVWVQNSVQFTKLMDTAAFTISTKGRKDFIYKQTAGPPSWQAQLFQVGGGLINIDQSANGTDTNTDWLISTPGSYYLKFTPTDPTNPTITINYTVQDTAAATTASSSQTVWRQSYVEFKDFVDTPTFNINSTGWQELDYKYTGPAWQVTLLKQGGDQPPDNPTIFPAGIGTAGTDQKVTIDVGMTGVYYLEFKAAQPGGATVHIDYTMQLAGGSASSSAPTTGPGVWKKSYVRFTDYVIVDPFTISTAGKKQVTFDETSGQWTLEVIDDIAAGVALYSPTGLMYESNTSFPPPSSLPVVKTGTTLPFTISKPGQYALVFHAMQEKVAYHVVNYTVTDA